MSSTEQSSIMRDRYDVVIAGARCSGASTAILLARRVLVVDPAERGSDTVSTHALMRGDVLQRHRWGVLDVVRTAEVARELGETQASMGEISEARRFLERSVELFQGLNAGLDVTEVQERLEQIQGVTP